MRSFFPLPARTRRSIRLSPLSSAFAALVLALAPAHDAGSDVRSFEQDPAGIERYEYVSPRPGSAMVSRWNNVALRPGSAIDGSSLAAARFTVRGSVSGAHGGALALSDDAKTIVFEPTTPFAPGEAVEVSLAGGIRTRAGEELPPLAFAFTVAAGDPAEPWPPGLAELLADETSSGSLARPVRASAGHDDRPATNAAEIPATLACGPLPQFYPPITVLHSNQPEPGYLFLAPFRSIPPHHMVIVDNLGLPVFYRQLPVSAVDFKVQPDGRISYFTNMPPGGGRPKFFLLDASYAAVDSFEAGNGYRTDSHELQLLPNGHALLMIYDPQQVRMDLVVSGGRPNARVTGLVIQELDADKNVVFQWRSWDHFQITDAAPSISLTGFSIDYVHGNAIEVDHDGHLLVSSRHLNEITKINRQTGEVMWRMGPNARRNQFTFSGDSRGFSYQHDIRRLPNGNVTLFDNGNFLSPQYSRALEYQIDEAAKHATLVWSHRNTPDHYGSFMGNVQRRASGQTLVGWGGSDPPNLTEIRPDGTKAFELGLVGGMWSYRGFRFPWRTTRFVTDVTALEFGLVRLHETASRTVSVRNPGTHDVTIHCAFTTDAAFTIVAPLPATLPPGGTMEVEVRFLPEEERHYAGKFYLRSNAPNEVIAQDVEVAGSGVTNLPPDCSLARATPDQLWPPNHQMVPVTIEGVSDPDGDPLAIEITSVLQDEAVPGPDEPSCPDAVVEGAVAWLRAERDGAGDGRVYRIGFTATDPAGARCEGSVRVCVPHDLGVGEPPDAATGPPAGCGNEAPAVTSLEPCAAPDAERRRVAPRAEAGLALRAGLAPSGAAGDRGVRSIEFTLPAESEVTLAIYDLAGRRVQVLESGRRAAGAHQVTWRTAGVGSGMYFCRVRAGDAAVTVPILVVR